MSELFKKTGQSIFSFKKGDIIIRLVSSKITKTLFNDDNLGICTVIEIGDDNAFRDAPVEFIGVYNNLIYLRCLKQWWDGSYHIFKVPVEKYEDGWQLFEIPEGLTLEQCI